MGFFYFDDSVHERGGFVLGAFVFCRRDPQRTIANTLREFGLVPGQDEFKSGDRKLTDERGRRVRERLWEVFSSGPRDGGVWGRVGLCVVPIACRSQLGDASLRCLSKIILNNELDPVPHIAYFDRGIHTNATQAQRLADALALSDRCELKLEQESKAVLGLQLADLVAHAASTMLLDELGLIRKVIPVGPNSGYDPSMEVDLGWLIWAGLRHHFFAKRPSIDAEFFDDPSFDKYKHLVTDVESCGLLVAESCGQRLREAVLRRFGRIYIGCIH